MSSRAFLRGAVLAAGFPIDVPGTTINRFCGSGQQAVHFAAQAIMSGEMDIVLAGGVEHMTRVPMGSNRDLHGKPFGWRLMDRFEMTSQGEAAERVADRWSISRTELDQFAVDYLDKNLKIKIKGGKQYNFTDPDGNADRLFVFQRDVDKARQRLGKGDQPAAIAQLVDGLQSGLAAQERRREAVHDEPGARDHARDPGQVGRGHHGFYE